MKATYPKEEIKLLEIEPEITEEIIAEQPKPKRERKLTPREQQMNKPIFSSNYEKYEWLMANGCTNSDDRNYNYWDKNETPKITKVTKDCVYIKFSENREACVSKEYGIATYYKQKTTAPNEEVIHETTVTELKDKFKDGYWFDFSTLEIPQDKKLKTEEEFHNEPG